MNVRKEVIIRLDGQVYDGHRLQNKVTSRVEDDPLSFKKNKKKTGVSLAGLIVSKVPIGRGEEREI